MVEDDQQFSIIVDHPHAHDENREVFGRGGAFVRGECGQIGCDKCRAVRSFANINQHAVSSRVSSDFL